MQDHVVLDESEGRLTVRIDDWELFDFIDDYLTDHDFEHAYRTEQMADGREIYVVHFPDGIDTNRLKALMNAIDPKEIERIWSINN